jgi:hypothetical protein
MRILATVLSLTICAAITPALAKPIVWECDMKPGESRAPGPDSYEEIGNVLIASRGDMDPRRARYTIMQESKDGLIAEISTTSPTSMGLDVILLNKKTGQFRSAFIFTNGWMESHEGKCFQK